jgi:hypothetical protein
MDVFRDLEPDRPLRKWGTVAAPAVTFSMFVSLRFVPLLFVSLLLVSLPSGLAAQDNPRPITGVVVEDVTGTPIEGALIILLDERDRPTGSQAVSGAGGEFSVIAPNPGVFGIRVRRLGFGLTLTPQFEVLAEGPMSVRVVMVMEPVEIDALEVGGEQIDWARRGFLAEFYHRVDQGTGRYLTREDLERYPASTILELVHLIPGFSTVSVGPGQRVITARRSASLQTDRFIRGQLSRVAPFSDLQKNQIQEEIEAGERDFDLLNTCPISFFVDGRPLNPGNNPSFGSVEMAYMLNADDIEGIEFYSGPSTTPGLFTGTDAGCGVIAIWTRRSQISSTSAGRGGGGISAR